LKEEGWKVGVGVGVYKVQTGLALTWPRAKQARQGKERRGSNSSGGGGGGRKKGKRKEEACSRKEGAKTRVG